MIINYEILLGPDKFQHALVCFLITLSLGVLVLLFSHTFEKARKRLFQIWAAIVLVGALDEYRQLFDPNRSAEFLDAVANLVGATLAILPLYLITFPKTDFAKKRKTKFPIFISLSLLLTTLLFIGLLAINEVPFLVTL